MKVFIRRAAGLRRIPGDAGPNCGNVSLQNHAIVALFGPSEVHLDALLNAIQKTPVSTILILAGLLFLVLGVVTKIGGFIEVSPEQKSWTLPLGLGILAIGLAFNFMSKPVGAPVASLASSPASAASAHPPDQVSFRSWQGAWNLQFEYDGQWNAKTMTIQSDPSGIQGDYELGRLKGVYDKSDVSTCDIFFERRTLTAHGMLLPV